MARINSVCDPSHVELLEKAYEKLEDTNNDAVPLVLQYYPSGRELRKWKYLRLLINTLFDEKAPLDSPNAEAEAAAVALPTFSQGCNELISTAGWERLNGPVDVSLQARGSKPTPNFVVPLASVPDSLDLEWAQHQFPYNQIWSVFQPLIHTSVGNASGKDLALSHRVWITVSSSRCIHFHRFLYSKPLSADLTELKADLLIAQAVRDSADTLLSLLEPSLPSTKRNIFRRWISEFSIAPLSELSTLGAVAGLNSISLDGCLDETTSHLVATWEFVLATKFLISEMLDKLNTDILSKLTLVQPEPTHRDRVSAPVSPECEGKRLKSKKKVTIEEAPTESLSEPKAVTRKLKCREPSASESPLVQQTVTMEASPAPLKKKASKTVDEMSSTSSSEGKTSSTDEDKSERRRAARLETGRQRLKIDNTMETLQDELSAKKLELAQFDERPALTPKRKVKKAAAPAPGTTDTSERPNTHA